MNVTKQLALPDTAANASHKAKSPRRDDSATTPDPPLSSRRSSAIPRITLSIDEAAGALGVSRDHLERHILRDLRIVHSGRRRLIPLRELERWAEHQAVATPATAFRGRA